MGVTRLEFIKGALVSLGFGAFGGRRLFAASLGWKHGGKPNLVFGVLADTHFRMDSEWRRGYVVRVYDDMLTIERREFGAGGSLGADWVMPFEREEGKGKWEGCIRFRRAS